MIKATLIKIWEGDIEQEYNNGTLCSERALQSELYRRLRDELPKEYTVWVEPAIRIIIEEKKRTIKPDILISKENEIVTVIELKYVPHYYANFIGDLKKLDHIAKQKSDYKFKLRTYPMTGKYDDNYFQFSKGALLVFAVIANNEAAALHPVRNFKKQVGEDIRLENFLVLRGTITPSKKPKFDYD